MKVLTKPQNFFNQGQALLEVLIALFVFTVFYTAYITSQGRTIATSTELKNELEFSYLADLVINEIILNPPPLNTGLTLSKETKKFEQQDFNQFTYTIEYKEFDLGPLLSAWTQFKDDENTDDPDKTANEQMVQNKVVTELAKFVKQKIWQVEVTITNTQTNGIYQLSTFLSNDYAKPQISL